MLILFKDWAVIKNDFKENCQSHKQYILKTVPVLRMICYSIRDVRAFRVSSQ